MNFYQSTDSQIRYSDLFEALSKRDKVCKSYFASTYFDFITNIVTAIIHDIDIALIDYRNSHPTQNKEYVDIVPKSISNISDLIARIQASQSSIGIYSSGTTGHPKLIYQKISRLLRSVQISEDYHQSRWAFTYNPSHSAGIQVFLQAVCNEAILYDLYKCSRAQILSTISNKNITHISATPTFYRMLAPYDFTFDSIQSLTFNGEKSTLALIDNLRKTMPNARVRNIYGSTESGPLMSSETTTFIVPHRLLDQIKIVDNELLINSKLISHTLQNLDWYATGDMVTIINDSPLTIQFEARKTGILNVGGHNVSPSEVEEVLLAHPSVKDTRVYGRENKIIGNLIVADVQLLPDCVVSEKELIRHCKTSLSAYKVPRMIKLVEHIKVGRTGKKSIDNVENE